MEFFLSPWMLWGAALGAAPIIIHLLNKRKFRESEWAAMRFLIQAVQKKSRRIRLEQLILLAIRALIMILLALALAEPHFRSLGLTFPADAPTHRIVVIDSTFSMGFQQENQSRFHQAQEVARQIIDQSGQGDAFNLLRIAEAAPQVIVATPSFRKEDLVEEISVLELPHGRGDVAPILESIKELLEEKSGVPERKEVYFISDFQSAGWLPRSNSQLTEFRNSMKQLGQDAQLVLIDLGKQSQENTAVTSLRTLQSHVAMGRPVQFEATVQNFGRIPQDSQLLEFLVDNKLQATRRVNLVPGTAASEIFTHTFSAGGEHRVEVRLQGDALDVDNRRWLSVPVRDRLNVLCVNGSRSGREMGNATDFLALALQPTEPSTGSTSPFSPRVIGSGDLVGQDLQDYDCIFMCNVALVTPAEANLLESFLKSGGGVVWSLGDRVDVENYNATLYRDGKGILPVKIGKRRGDAAKRSEAFYFDPGDYAHPIVADFQGNPQAGLGNTLTYEYYQLTLPPRSSFRVALRFNTGDPAIIDGKIDGGPALVVATSLDDSWGNWALWPSYLPMIREMAQLACSGRTGQRDFSVGQPIERVLPARAFDVDITVVRPGGGTTPARITQSESISEFQFADTQTSGIYEVNFGPPLSDTELFAVNVDTAESNLTSLSRDELAAELLPGIDFDYQTDLEQNITSESGTVAERGGLSRGLLYVVLFLVFVELLMAWQFRYGLWLLFPPLAVVAVYKYWRA
ncbi:BatA domain-containing protein [Symmachiella macrocystis]|nr:BatA domain-containing protein [Symmachiella macrocystis]